MHEIEAIASPVCEQIETSLKDKGAMTTSVTADRNRMLIVMGIAAFLLAITTVPSVKSMSAIGILAIGIGIIGIGIGWWWLGYRRYTTPSSEKMLAAWLESASAAERSAFDLATRYDLIADQVGGPDVTAQTKLSRQLRGLGST